MHIGILKTEFIVYINICDVFYVLSFNVLKIILKYIASARHTKYSFFKSIYKIFPTQNTKYGHFRLLVPDLELANLHYHSTRFYPMIVMVVSIFTWIITDIESSSS